MNPINPHTTLAKPDIDHPSFLKEGKRVVSITPPLLAKKGAHVFSSLLAKEGTREVTTRHGNNHITPEEVHIGEK